MYFFLISSAIRTKETQRVKIFSSTLKENENEGFGQIWRNPPPTPAKQLQFSGLDAPPQHQPFLSAVFRESLPLNGINMMRHKHRCQLHHHCPPPPKYTGKTSIFGSEWDTAAPPQTFQLPGFASHRFHFSINMICHKNIGGSGNRNVSLWTFCRRFQKWVDQF